MSDGKLLDRAMNLSFEDALTEIQRLENATVKETAAATVHSGKHPEWGCVHIVLPPAGGGILLKPFAIQDF